MRLEAVLVPTLVAALAWATARADEGAPPRAPGERLPTTSHTIQEIQGAGPRSPLVGTEVTDVVGVVTDVTSTSFTFQAPPDDDPGTSDALLVYVGRGWREPLPQVGDEVAVSGKVTEWASRVRGEVPEGALTQTQLERPIKVRVLASGCELPAPVVVGKSGRMPPVRPLTAGHLEVWDPAEDAFDFWESLEHMRVVINDAVVVGPTAHGEFHVVPEGGAGYPDRTTRGGVLLANEEGQACPGVITIDNAPNRRVPTVTVGDRVARLEGLVVPDAARPARVLVADVEVTRAAPERAPTRLESDDEHLTIASFNAENFTAADSRKAQELARGLVRWLKSPAIVALQEVQDDDGPGAEGKPGWSDVVSAAKTYEVLIEAIVAAGGPRYRWTDVPPLAHQEGGQPGGNIRVGFLYDPARVTFEPRGEAGPLDPNRVEVVDGRARLALNPGRVEPQDEAFAETRRTLAAEFRFRGHTVVVLNSHFSSRRGDEPTFGPRQPPALHSEPRRLGQARAVHRFVRELAEKDPQVTILHLGDCNDFHFRPALKELAGDVLEILTWRLPPGERYSYVFQGTSQALDHALLGGPLKGKPEGVELEYVRVCAEYPSQNRMSDHDPLVVRLHLP